MCDPEGQPCEKTGFWNSDKIERLGPGIIDKFNVDRIECNAYELSVADEYFATSMEDGKDKVAEGKQIIVPPGQLALLITEEVVKLPPTTMGFIAIKFKEKFRGLINVSGFHVDPGFQGRLKFSVYNAGSENAVFDPGKELFVIWFADLIAKETRVYDGAHKDQMEISAEDVKKVQGDIASPGQLKKEIQKLRESQRRHAWVFSVLTTLFFAVLLIPALKGLREDASAPKANAETQETSDANGAVDVNLKIQTEGPSGVVTSPEPEQLKSDQTPATLSGENAERSAVRPPGSTDEPHDP